MMYGRCLGIAAARTDLWGGIAVMDLLGKDLLLPITDTLMIFGAHLVHFFWYTHFGALFWYTHLVHFFGIHILVHIFVHQYLLHPFMFHQRVDNSLFLKLL